MGCNKSKQSPSKISNDPQNGIKVNQDVINNVNHLKTLQQFSYIFCKVNEKETEIIKHTYAVLDFTFTDFKNRIQEQEPGYYILNYPFQKEDGQIVYTLVYIEWLPNEASQKQTLVTQSFNKSLLNIISDVKINLKANKLDDITEEIIKQSLPKA